MVGRAKTKSFQHLVEKHWNKISSWKNKLLSTTSKEIVLKLVLQAIPTYTMSIFILPKSTSRKLNSLLKNLGWGMNGESSKIHWLEQTKLGVTKEKGDLRMRDLCSFNLALLVKQCWRMLHNPKSLVTSIFKQIILLDQ